MLYRPPETMRMWDTTLFKWERYFHLFFLNKADRGTLGHATSENLLHWETHDIISLKGEIGSWNESGIPLTGCIVYHDQKFYLFGGNKHPATGEQVCGAFLSEDLFNWEPHPMNPIFKSQKPHYSTTVMPYDGGMFSAWRDPSIIRDAAGVYHAFICARLPQWNHTTTGAAIGHLQSTDLIHWEYLPPIVVAGDKVRYCEVPDIFEMNGTWYALFLDHSWGGSRICTPSRNDAAGTFYMMSDDLHGPFTWPGDSLLIGSGNHRVGAWAARTIEHEGYRLLYHHTVVPRSSLGAPKRIQQMDDRSLVLKYYPFAEKLETRILQRGFPDSTQQKEGDLGEWIINDSILEGKAYSVGSSTIICKNTSNFHLKCTIMMKKGSCAGFVVRSSGEFSPEKFISSNIGIGIILDVEKQLVKLEPVTYISVQGWGLGVMDCMQGEVARDTDTCSMKLDYGTTYQLRCIARDEFVDVYLDDRWLFTKAFPQASREGALEFFVERGNAAFSDFRLAEIEPL